jgi:glyoxylase-like metal-dependent hydrolase (beta-lactamase superfamily II)
MDFLANYALDRPHRQCHMRATTRWRQTNWRADDQNTISLRRCAFAVGVEAMTNTTAIHQLVGRNPEFMTVRAPKAFSFEPEVAGFYDTATGSIQYIAADPITRKCAVIDPVLDFEPKSGSTRTTSADGLLNYIDAHGLTLEWILDTHPHADHFSAAGYLKDVTGASTGIGERVKEVQRLWKKLYNLPASSPINMVHWDHLFADGEWFTVGELDASVLLSPGHTLASVTYIIGNAAFVHDTIFMPDSGTARADFPGGDAWELWRSIQKILQLPTDTRLFTGHDYRPNGREPRWESTIAAQREHNLHLKDVDEEKFVRLRTERDRTLPLPALMLSALQVNLAGGRLPPPESDGRQYLKIPLNAFPRAL